MEVRDGSSDGCPKCGNPRLPEALDCPYCGIVYGRYRGDGPAGGSDERSAGGAAAGGGAVAPQASPGGPGRGLYFGAPGPGSGQVDPPAPDAEHGSRVDAVHGDLYVPPPPDARRRSGRAGSPAAIAPAGAPQVRETLLTRDLFLSLLIAGVLFLGLQGYWSSVLFGASTSEMRAEGRFFQLTGLQPPDGLDDAVVFRLGGRHVVMMEQDDEPEDQLALGALVFHPGSAGNEVPAERLLDGVERRLEALGIPFRSSPARPLRFGREDTLARTFRLGPGETEVGRVRAFAFQGPDGLQTLLVLWGSPRAVTRLEHDYR